MQFLFDIGAVIIGYILGSIPFGLLIVKLKTGKDIRKVESGRTGGTNAVRAAGLGAGLLTAALDVLKGALAVWIAQTLSPGNHLIHILAPVAAILGHNHSIFLIERDEDGALRLRGGAGGAPALGGAMGLWLPMFPIVVLAGALVWFTLGIASVTTMTIGLVVVVVFAIRASLGLQDPIDIWYGVIAQILLLWALRPNIKKLISGNERIVKYSLNGWLRARKEAQGESNQ
ncbi:MAG TPA: glycerol-3-phosphate acyltransferase [Anaerolineales bacterium]|nr:glycerol-3-phosphate acyltransferase [Anaerolineales bacterium]